MTDAQKKQIREYRNGGYGYKKIAQTLGISVNTVKSFCRRNDINGDTVIKPSVTLTGEIQQIAKQKKKRFCCDKCRNEWWNSHLDQVKRKAVYDFKCPHCGKEFHIYGDRRRKYCSHECYIADRFKGGGGDE